MNKQKSVQLSFSHEIMEWARNVAEKIEKKMSRVTDRNGEKIIYSLDQDGKGEDQFAKNCSSWVNGFWPGMHWLLYLYNQDVKYMAKAKEFEEKLDEALFVSPEGFDRLHHDVGFMWIPTALASYRITKDAESRKRGLIAANYLASRYNPDAEFITAWNTAEKESWSIIDTMMNIPLLYWASAETGYSRFAKIAVKHAKKTAQNAVRPDGSVNHIVKYDLDNGAFIESYGGQGYEVGSCWSRGTAWAIYGFTLSYLNTGECIFLETAKKTANYFLSAVQMTDYIPLSDFRAPKEPVLYDSSAGAIAASGMLTLATLLPEYERQMYQEGAIRILKALETKCCDFTDSIDLFLGLGSEAHWKQEQKYMVYGEMYFFEAILKILGRNDLSGCNLVEK